MFIKAATSVLLSKSQIEFIKYLGMNANQIGSQEKPLKRRKTKAYMSSEMLENILPSYVAELALSKDKVDRRLHSFIISQGY